MRKAFFVATLVDQFKVPFEHLSLILASEVRMPVLAGRCTVGWFFKGDGTFVYASKNGDEFRVMEFNLKNASSLDSDIHWFQRESPTMACGRLLPLVSAEHRDVRS